MAVAPQKAKVATGLKESCKPGQKVRYSLAYLGPVLLVKLAQVDLVNGTAKLPLHKDKLASGETVWFILTDTTDENLADLHGRRPECLM
jgi:hypothetical protein